MVNSAKAFLKIFFAKILTSCIFLMAFSSNQPPKGFPKLESQPQTLRVRIVSSESMNGKPRQPPYPPKL